MSKWEGKSSLLNVNKYNKYMQNNYVWSAYDGPYHANIIIKFQALLLILKYILLNYYNSISHSFTCHTNICHKVYRTELYLDF